MFLLFHLVFPFTEPDINSRTGSRQGTQNWWKSLERDYRVSQAFSSGNEHVSNQNGLPARLLEAQVTQSIFYCAALNGITRLGMTESR